MVAENLAKTEKKENIIYFNKKLVVSFKVRDNVKNFFNWRENMYNLLNFKSSAHVLSLITIQI